MRRSQTPVCRSQKRKQKSSTYPPTLGGISSNLGRDFLQPWEGLCHQNFQQQNKSPPIDPNSHRCLFPVCFFKTLPETEEKAPENRLGPKM